MRFSISVKMYSGALKAIAAIPESVWTPNPYFLDGAEVAETEYTPFAKRPGPRPVRPFR